MHFRRQHLIMTVTVIGFAAIVILRSTLFSDWPFQLDATSDLVKNRARVRKAGSNASIWKAIDNKQTQKEHVLNGQSGSGVLPRQFLKEEDLRYELPLTDIRLTVDIAASTVRLIEKQDTFKTGDKIEVFIILRDGYKKQREKGGDDLRVRTFNDDLNAYAAGQVKDHNNGTYTASVLAHWSGKHFIEVMLVHTRESIRALYQIRKNVPSTRIKQAIFRKNGKEALGNCHPHLDKRVFEQGSETCDLTSRNSGMSWFCAKPTGFQCEDVTSMKHGYVSVENIPITKAEKDLFRSLWKLFQPIILDVLESDKNKSTSLPDCGSYPRQLLWTKTEVRGYFYKNTWRHLQCQEPTEDSYRTCLNGKRVILTGDSTTRDWFRYLMKEFNCNLVTQKWKSSKWYKRTSCESKINKLKIEWVPHAMPFFGDYEFSEIHSISKVLEGIDNKTETVILIHMYFHLVFYHYSVFKQRMQTISKAVARAIEKNERVTVLIKGPSTCKQLDREYVNDYYGYVYKDIIREAFKEMYDKVVFLDMQEMTIAKRTPDIHPPPDEVREAVHQMLDYVCADSRDNLPSVFRTKSETNQAKQL